MYSIYIRFSKEYKKGLTFLLFLLPMKYSKSCLSKGNLVDTAVSLISISFIKTQLLYG